jgi:Rps23 Pro-64 3,4-dihydroxylase Tpa1-like proline 4-hydroxylase
MQIESLEDNILYFTEIFKNPNEIINSLENINEFSMEDSPISKWKEWRSSNSETVYGSLKVCSFEKALSRNIYEEEQILISIQIKKVVDECALKYKEITGIDPDVLPDHYTINKYLPGLYMGPHVDYEGEGRTTLTPSVSMVLYLNENYEGGEIAFPEQKLLIKPKAGSLVVFPSNKPYYHEAKEVISGTKYMVPLFWFSSKV